MSWRSSTDSIVHFGCLHRFVWVWCLEFGLDMRESKWATWKESGPLTVWCLLIVYLLVLFFIWITKNLVLGSWSHSHETSLSGLPWLTSSRWHNLDIYTSLREGGKPLFTTLYLGEPLLPFSSTTSLVLYKSDLLRELFTPNTHHK